jgi:uncharacterized protein with PIN domain
MDKTYIFYFLLLILGMNVLVNFIENINKDDENLLTRQEIIIKRDHQYYKKDSIGDNILVLPKEMEINKKKKVLKRSFIFKEIVNEFPMFSEMIF